MKNLQSLAFPLALALLVAACAQKPTDEQTSGQEADLAQMAKEEANRKLVTDFYDGVFNQHNVVSASEVLAMDYKQHNPEVPDGKAPFVDYFRNYFKVNPNSKAKVVRSAADGDLVWLHVNSTEGEGDRGLAVVDVFRVANGKIVEHWDVIQPVPGTSANANTMF